jgi:hypothetical protein
MDNCRESKHQRVLENGEENLSQLGQGTEKNFTESHLNSGDRLLLQELIQVPLMY